MSRSQGGALFLLLLAAGCAAQADSPCGQLLRAQHWQDLPDAPTALTEAAEVDNRDDLPAHCGVAGYVAPQVRFQIRLPLSNWNGKLLMQGCGGLCGGMNDATCDDALARNYAVVVTDMGHQAPPWQAHWAFENLQAEIDFAYRATHVVAVAAKAVTTSFYGRSPSRTYLRGCSTGGRQGLVAAQRFPDDFDGIIAGAPVLDETGTAALHLIWSGRANLDDNGSGILSSSQVGFAHKRVVDTCDPQDGKEDGIIEDPRDCDWEAVLTDCRGSNCFSDAEIRVFQKLYGGAVTSSGRALVPGGLMPGSEYEWVPNFVGEDGPAVFHPDGPIRILYQNLLFFRDPGPGASAAEFDFDRDPPRLALMETLYSARNPDLRRFRERGGRLIMYQGWDDIEVTPMNTIDYFETMQATMGGAAATREFARLFMMPGVAHCRRGPGADTVDWLSYLEAWVERGEAPESVTAFHQVQTQNYLGLPRPRFPLAREAWDWSRSLKPVSP